MFFISSIDNIGTMYFVIANVSLEQIEKESYITRLVMTLQQCEDESTKILPWLGVVYVAFPPFYSAVTK